MPRRDPNTRDLFEVPQPAAPLPGSMDFRPLVCGVVGEMLKGRDRYEVAAVAAKLIGRDVTTYTIDGYCAASRGDYNLPLHMVPALEVACGSHALTNWLAGVRGGRLMIGRDALAAELGRIQREKEDLAAAERALKEQMRRGA